ncbi:bifunctional heparan sulfate N-deacetylase/N-sulfotransferase 3-like isoform X1 [Sycon ciliatum]|uniref:bifunctional heparan sulfate N-deacetylase/N-sulfotransferase 3-like isoform X1 n=1 Tax=Sycon ciliatum TaxID=27933 RepID=UPI0031F6139B
MDAHGAHASGRGRLLPSVHSLYRPRPALLAKILVASVVSTLCLVAIFHSGTPTYRDAYTVNLQNMQIAYSAARATVSPSINDGIDSVKHGDEDANTENHLFVDQHDRSIKQAKSDDQRQQHEAVQENRKMVMPHALLISSAERSVTSYNVRIWLQSFRIVVVEKVVGRHNHLDLGPLVRQQHVLRTGAVVNAGEYALVIIDDISLYTVLGHQPRSQKGKVPWQKELDSYCLEYGVGQILFPGQLTAGTKILQNIGWSFAARPVAGLTHATIPPVAGTAADGSDGSEFLYVAKSGRVLRLPDHNTLTLVFTPFHETFRTGVVMWRDEQEQVSLPDGAPTASLGRNYTTLLVDRGLQDGVKRIFFGRGLFFWMHKILFLDAVRYLSATNWVESQPRGFGDFGLKRFITIDVDDVFSSPEVHRMTASDVDALVALQGKLAKHILNFQFQLGFVGGVFELPQENSEGDTRLIAAAKHFLWFDHTYRHDESRWFKTDAELEQEMQKAKAFAQDRNLNIVDGYAVSPRHSGVYPVDPRLFRVWRKTWNIGVTVTEEYPHLKPASKRRGFIYQGTKVLPRQTCGLFTTTNYMSGFPGGEKRLTTFVEGGELFLTVLRNPVSLFMTHANNYANDRLAHTVFTRLVNFISSWTNLQLHWEPPLHLANRYFSLFPEDAGPVWENPCSDVRHLFTWNHKPATCREFPSALLIGPSSSALAMDSLVLMLQSTGAGLKQQPAQIIFHGCRPGSSEPGAASHVVGTPGMARCHRKMWDSSFFSSNESYGESLDRYLGRLQANGLNTSVAVNATVADASTRYFQSAMAPQRAHALLPAAHVVIVLMPLIDEVLHCYLHRTRYWPGMEAVEDDRAERRHLDRCLAQSDYATHLRRWLQHYSEEMVVLVDGDYVVSNPHRSMSSVRMAVLNSTRVPASPSSSHTWTLSKSMTQLCLKSTELRSLKHETLASAPCYSMQPDFMQSAGNLRSTTPVDVSPDPVRPLSAAVLRQAKQELEQDVAFLQIMRSLKQLYEGLVRVRKVGRFEWLH